MCYYTWPHRTFYLKKHLTQHMMVSRLLSALILIMQFIPFAYLEMSTGLFQIAYIAPNVKHSAQE